ncbi:hypothetical protein ACFPU0_04195 [Pseudomonas sp. GCM10022186]|uniref:hypothetical protein n=1 Tax=Pseudomonas sp. GCM10022186 TaxID=3252650 RepID=UPI00360BB5DB
MGKTPGDKKARPVPPGLLNRQPVLDRRDGRARAVGHGGMIGAEALSHKVIFNDFVITFRDI